MRHRPTLALGVAALVVGFAAPPQPAHAASANVAALQVALRAEGLAPGPIDGITGPRTSRALRRFQAHERLAVDGVAGPRTRHALGRRGRPPLGSRPLRDGMRGWDVAALQFLLSSRGYGPGGFDGRFGPNTLDAVERFQGAAGLTADGVAGPITLRALRERRLSVTSPQGPVRFLRPIAGAIGDGFGYPGGRKHTGIDIPADSGTPVGAGGVGVVVFAGWNSGGYGNLVVVRHRLGYESWYAHLSSISVSAGEPVTGGSRIGYVGATGHATGPHLHFEVRHFGTPVDPVPYLLTTVAARAPSGPHAAGHREPAHNRRRLVCRPNADAFTTRDTDPRSARIDRCP